VNVLKVISDPIDRSSSENEIRERIESIWNWLDSNELSKSQEELAYSRLDDLQSLLTGERSTQTVSDILETMGLDFLKDSEDEHQ